MAKITVMIYTTLRKRLGISRLDLGGSTVREVLDRLCDYKKPEAADLIRDAEGNVRQHFVLTLNSEILDNKKTASVPVKDGDILHVFPPVSGGWNRFQGENMKPVKITEGVYSLRLNHFNRRLFDALIPLPEGTSYNAYLVKGSEKTALIDSGDPEKAEILFDYLKDEKKIDYIISQHAEQDHSGSIPLLLARHPEAMVVTNPKCKDLLMTHLHLPAEKIIEIKDGETLPLGGKTLEFLYMPWVHWPETMGTYLREDKCLFSCDFFGSHLATNELFSDEHRVYEPMKRYFAEIMMPFRSNIKSHLEKLAKYEISFIAPSHGPVHNDAKFIMDIYRDWAVGEPRNKVLVAYVSMHGSTLLLVNRLVNRLQEAGVCVEKLNLEQFDEGRVAMALVDAATIVIGTPTVLTGPHPKAVYGAHLANLLRPKAKFVSVIGSFGWGGRAVETIAGMIPNIKAEVLKPIMVKGMPTEADLRLVDELAALIVEKHAGLPLCG